MTAMVIQNHTCLPSFRLKAIAKQSTAMQFSIGKARSNLPSSTSGQTMSAQPAIQHNTPHQGKRIFLAALMSSCSCNLRSLFRTVQEPLFPIQGYYELGELVRIARAFRHDHILPHPAPARHSPRFQTETLPFLHRIAADKQGWVTMSGYVQRKVCRIAAHRKPPFGPFRRFPPLSCPINQTILLPNCRITR